MPIFIFAVLINFLRVLRIHLRNGRQSRPKTLCTDCLHAHMQYGSKAERAISCTFGGGIRSINLDVLYCTHYQNRSVPVRVRMIGFERQVARSE